MTVIAKIVLVVNVRGGITNGNGERTKRAGVHPSWSPERSRCVDVESEGGRVPGRPSAVLGKEKRVT